MFIRTERLLLHPTWPEDLDELLALIGEESVARNLDVQGLPRSREALEAYIARPSDPLLPHFFIERRGDDGMELVGGIGLGRDGTAVELGSWIAPAWRGHGFAVEALLAVLDHARMLGHRRLIACHFVDNQATGRVLEKACFVATGVLRDRFSPARGGMAPALVYEADLAEPLAGTSAGAAAAAQKPFAQEPLRQR